MYHTLHQDFARNEAFQKQQQKEVVLLNIPTSSPYSRLG